MSIAWCKQSVRQSYSCKRSVSGVVDCSGTDLGQHTETAGFAGRPDMPPAGSLGPVGTAVPQWHMLVCHRQGKLDLGWTYGGRDVVAPIGNHLARQPQQESIASYFNPQKPHHQSHGVAGQGGGL